MVNYKINASSIGAGLSSVLLIFLSLSLWSSVSFAATLSPAELAAKLQATYEKTTSFGADFKQSTTLMMTGRSRKGTGHLIIKKPGRMRWDYLTPDKQVLLCDGEKMYMYFAKNQQMMVSDAKAYLQSDVTYGFFTGTGNILRDFTPGKLADIAAGDKYGFKLTPKIDHPQVEYINIWLRDDFLVKRLQIIDHFGSVTDISLSNLEINKAVSDDLFVFTPPPGTEIME